MDETRTVRTRTAVEAHLRAFNEHDAGAVLAGFAPDAVWTTGQDTFTGTGALSDLFDEVLWTLRPSLEVLSLVCEGAGAAAELREALVVDGETRTFTVGAFFLVDERGLIIRGRVYREGSADIE